MAPTPKLAPEVQLPRPRSSGVAVVALAALAMFTAIGASAFVVRVRMAASQRTQVYVAEPPILSGRPRPIVNVVEAFLDAAARQQDRTALELYRQIPPGIDRDGHLAETRHLILQRQIVLIDDEATRGDCRAMHAHIDWMHTVLRPEEAIGLRSGTCEEVRYIRVELAPTRRELAKGWTPEE